jgi:PAS domain S-box-containing protein
MSETQFDIKALALAFEEFNRTTQTLEEAYRRLEVRVQELDAEVAAKNQELAMATDYMNSILQSMSDGVVAVDTDGVVTTFNRAAAQILGYTAEEAAGRPFRDLFARDFEVADGATSLELVSKSGVPHLVSERNSPLTDRNQTVIGSVKVFQDLSEIEALRERVRQKDRLAAIGEMAATVAHEIRNPLGGIRGFAALLKRDIPEDDPKARLIEKVLAGTTALDRVVGELLEYTRPLELRLRSTNCLDLIEAALGYLEFGGRAIELRRDLAPDTHILADPDRIRQVFLNILLNAVQSIEETGEIRVAMRDNGSGVDIDFSDTGAGIANEALDKIFAPFFTTKEKGTGLGLAVAAKIVEAHGGTLTAVSELGIGSTFTVTLPKAV